MLDKVFGVSTAFLWHFIPLGNERTTLLFDRDGCSWQELTNIVGSEQTCSFGVQLWSILQSLVWGPLHDFNDLMKFDEIWTYDIMTYPKSWPTIGKKGVLGLGHVSFCCFFTKNFFDRNPIMAEHPEDRMLHQKNFRSTCLLDVGFVWCKVVFAGK